MVDVVSGGLEQTLDQIPAEERVVGALLVVDPADGLMAVFAIRIPVNDLSTWIRRLRQLGQELQGSFVEQRRIDAVVHERSSQIDLPAAVAAR